jgi:hypothetical protein
MGWRLRLLAVFVGLVSLAAGAAPVAILCFVYLVLSYRRRGPSNRTKPRKSLFTLRHLLALSMFALATIAIGSGGTYSPIVFGGTGAVLLLWPILIRMLPLGELVPVSDSIILRSKYFPISWCALAEIKPGAEGFPRAASSFTGTMLLLTGTGRAYSLARCRSWSRRNAEAQVLAKFRSSEPTFRAGAHLLPLDSVAASEVLRVRVSPTNRFFGNLPESASGVSGLLALDCSSGFVRKAAAYEIRGSHRFPNIPAGGRSLDGQPLTWELLDSIGKRTRWPEPDSFTNLLESLSVTKGVPLGERLQALEGAEGGITVRSLSGDEVRTTKTQFRAIVSIYS